jgi:hypothetical protein
MRKELAASTQRNSRRTRREEKSTMRNPTAVRGRPEKWGERRTSGKKREGRPAWGAPPRSPVEEADDAAMEMRHPLLQVRGERRKRELESPADEALLRPPPAPSRAASSGASFGAGVEGWAKEIWERGRTAVGVRCLRKREDWSRAGFLGQTGRGLGPGSPIGPTPGLSIWAIQRWGLELSNSDS